MIKRKVQKKRNPYREDHINDDVIDLKMFRYAYDLGYLFGLFHGIQKIDKSSEGFEDKNINEYYFKGYNKGIEDSKEQLKLIPKKNLKQYIEDLEYEIHTL